MTSQQNKVNRKSPRQKANDEIDLIRKHWNLLSPETQKLLQSFDLIDEPDPNPRFTSRNL